jgi:hypothetical protein
MNNPLAKELAASGLLMALSRIAKLGDKAQELALDAMHSFDEYQKADPRCIAFIPVENRVCLHCGKPTQEREDKP